jgi:hypothetical protein
VRKKLHPSGNANVKVAALEAPDEVAQILLDDAGCSSRAGVAKR